MSADLEIGFKFISEKYRSNVTLERPISVKARSENTMLFSHFDSSWEFSPGPEPNTTLLSFHVDFGFKSPLYRQAVDVVFDQVVVRIISAFERRCRSIHGPPVRVRGPFIKNKNDDDKLEETTDNIPHLDSAASQRRKVSGPKAE